jgi:NTE family protein
MKLVIVAILIGIVGCQTPQRREMTPKTDPDRPAPVRPKEATTTTLPDGTTQVEDKDDKVVVDDNTGPDEVDTDIKPKPVPRLPKVGVIFGPGGGRTYGQIGVLQEFQKNKIPIFNTAGVEMGALVASLYSWRGSVNDIEWQMFKIKNDDILKKNIISGKKAGDFQAISNVIKTAFHNLKAEDFKKQFSCPALNLQKNKIFMMNRGNLEALLPYCIPYPPLFKPYQKNLSAIREVKAMADHLRKQGANYIVFINVLGGNPSKTPLNDADSMENLVWSEIASHLAKDSTSADFTITVNLDSYSILDFENKRDMMLKGSEQTARVVKELAEKLGL